MRLLPLLILTPCLAAGCLARIEGAARGLFVNPGLYLSGVAGYEPSYPEGLRPLPIELEIVGRGFRAPTDLRFVPNRRGSYVVAELTGKLRWATLEAGGPVRDLFEVDVTIFAERGLLSLALHPDYPDPPCIYVSYVVEIDDQDKSRVAEWCSATADPESAWSESRLLFELDQPYGNHNGGQILFDAGGALLLGWGDGGGREDGGTDPHENGQDPTSFLGSILRIRLTERGATPPYTIPEDNPFVDDPSVPDEVFAYGFRNPWRISFDRRGRMVAADVGLLHYEEITFVEAGRNHGGNVMEGFHCRAAKPSCDAIPFVPPIVEIEHPLSVSVTGGYEVTSNDYPELAGQYVFGDFVTGQFFAIELPDPGAPAQDVELRSLGRHPVFAATFARDPEGRVYVADFARGDLFRIVRPRTP